jgi:hypothetical protein
MPSRDRGSPGCGPGGATQGAEDGRMNRTEKLLSLTGGLLGGVLTALVARVLEHRLLNPRRPA